MEIFSIATVVALMVLILAAAARQETIIPKWQRKVGAAQLLVPVVLGTGVAVLGVLVLTSGVSAANGAETVPAGRMSLNPPQIPLAYPNAITGTVFRDFDFDGVFDPGEPGIGGIIVTAYLDTGVFTSTTTAADGTYSFNVPENTSVRLEITGIPDYLQPGAAGTDSQTTIAFVDVGAGGTNVVDVGLLNPADFAGDNPSIIVSAFWRGSNIGVNDQFAIIEYPYTANDPADTLPAITLATPAQVGTVYGLAQQRSTETIFASAYVKRGAGLGPTESTGAIYRASTGGAGTAGTFIDLNATGVISTGPNPHPSATTIWDVDSESYGAVGKVGLGDLDIADDEQTLYTVNLFNKELVILPLGLDGTGQPVAPAPGDILTRTIPVDPSCDGDGVTLPSADDLRPFALKFFDGKVYVGAVCSGQSMLQNLITPPLTITDVNPIRANMRAYVYEFDPATNTFNSTPILSFTLDYPRQQVNDLFPTRTENDGEWLPWSDEWRPDYAPYRPGVPNDEPIANPQPMLVDIEFDRLGFMTLGFRDRFGDQAYFFRDPGPNDELPLYNGRQGGDLLLACLDSAGNWQLEGSGSCTNGLTSETRTAVILSPDSGPASSTTPTVFNEFYHMDLWEEFHDETALGALALLPGSGELVFSKYDSRSTFENGTWIIDNTTGGPDDVDVGDRVAAVSQRVAIYGSRERFGKGAGMGDVELLLEAAPLELGNRVWFDEDRDGIQDPGDPPLSGVEVVLLLGGTPVATATTDAGGNYYFIGSNHPNAGTVGDNYGVVDGPLLPDTPYEIRIGLGQPVIVDNNYILTSPNQNGDASNNNKTDLNDSDGFESNGNASVSVTTGPPGANNHTLDFGFVIETTAVDLLYFEADRLGDGTVELRWATAVEIDNFGFRCLRSTSGQLADAVDIGLFVPGQGRGTASGATYSVIDRLAEAGQGYSYWLVDVDTSGSQTRHGPVTVAGTDPDNDGGASLYLPIITKN